MTTNNSSTTLISIFNQHDTKNKESFSGILTSNDMPEYLFLDKLDSTTFLHFDPAPNLPKLLSLKVNLESRNLM